MATFPEKTLLSIDDDEGTLVVIKAALQLMPSWLILTANSGQNGLVTAQSNRLDAILLDGKMPGMDGIATLQQLRAQPRTQHIPVVFLTANPEMMATLQKTELGIRGILTKPFDATILAHQVSQTLGWV